MTDRRIYEYPIPGHPGASHVVSYGWRRDEIDGSIRVEPLTSFLVRGPWRAAEWEPCHGPIQVWNRCEEGHPNSKPSYAYPFVVVNDAGNWSQMAVEENDLQGKLIRHDLGGILRVLRRWADTTGDDHPCPQCPRGG